MEQRATSAYNERGSKRLQLPLGDINVVSVTDVHSWVGGHGRHEANLDADYGDVLSFYQELQEAAKAEGKDVFFVMNGDMVDGTGLSTVPPDHLVPILEKMPFSAINMGNHELYYNQTVEYLRDSGFFEHWKGNYLTSNTFWAGTNDFIGHPYTFLYGTSTRVKILTFGFLYNFESSCEITRVMKVQEAVESEWFQQVLLERDYDAIMVLAHMDFVDPLVAFLHQTIRALVGSEMPIQFINGHSHRRGAHVYDQTCTAFEPGRFLDTVGYVSFPTYQSVRRAAAPETLFQHVFLDANKKILADTTGSTHKTEDGTSLSNSIHQTQHDMALDQVLGCVSQSYPIDVPLNDTNSLYGLYMRHVFPFAFGYNASKIFVQSTGALRYSLLSGQVTMDDVIAVCPFDDVVFEIAQSVKGSEILASFGNLLATSHSPQEWPFPLIFSGPGIVPDHWYDVYAGNFELQDIRQRLAQVTGRHLEPPVAFEREDGTIVTNTAVWKEYVTAHWPCHAQVSLMRRLTKPLTGSRTNMPESLGVFFLIGWVVTVFAIGRRRRQTVLRSRISQTKTFPSYGTMDSTLELS